LGFIDGLTKKSKVADIGCGTGGQTMVLAQNIPCEIIGIELWSDFIINSTKTPKIKSSQQIERRCRPIWENLPFQAEN